MKKYLLGMLWGLWVCAAQAAIVPGLYDAKVPVASDADSARPEAMGRALGQVLVKVSGNTAVVTLPAIQKRLSNAGVLAQSYRYETGPAAPALRLEVNFDPRAVRQLLAQAGQAVWRADRPLILAFVVVGVHLGAEVLSSDLAHDDATQALRAAAADRGLPLILPVMDLQDMNAVSAEDIWKPDTKKLQAAAQRYRPDVVIAGRVQRVTEQDWKGTWVLLSDGQAQQTWEVTGTDAAAALKAGVDAVANALATRFAVVQPSDAVSAAGLTLRITGVQSLDDYAAVVKYLRGLSPVTGVAVVGVEPGQMVVEVSVAGGASALVNAIHAEHRLTPVATPASAATQPDGATVAAPAAPAPAATQPDEALAAPAQSVLEYRWVAAP